jgi:hypothetical protein
MIRIAITAEAFDAVVATRRLGSVGCERKGEVWVCAEEEKRHG